MSVEVLERCRDATQVPVSDLTDGISKPGLTSVKYLCTSKV